VVAWRYRRCWLYCTCGCQVVCFLDGRYRWRVNDDEGGAPPPPSSRLVVNPRSSSSRHWPSFSSLWWIGSHLSSSSRWTESHSPIALVVFESPESALVRRCLPPVIVLPSRRRWVRFASVGRTRRGSWGVLPSLGACRCCRYIIVASVSTSRRCGTRVPVIEPSCICRNWLSGLRHIFGVPFCLVLVGAFVSRRYRTLLRLSNLGVGASSRFQGAVLFSPGGGVRDVSGGGWEDA